MAGGAVAAGSGSAPYVGAANDGSLREDEGERRMEKLKTRCVQHAQ